MKIPRSRLTMVALSLLCSKELASAASCGNGAGGFEAWKSQIAEEMRGRHGGGAIAALEGTRYNTATIRADRGQGGFHVSLDSFLARRGGREGAAFVDGGHAVTIAGRRVRRRSSVAASAA